ncbi:MAG: Hsp20/alpha crystallin family protein [Melioribacteraceae bacterium]|nr:Hsp20/alpha crystallin family protein [Melioribacteraceae bacterium]
MTLVKFNPVKEFDSFHDTIQKYFEDFSLTRSSLRETFSPKIDISEEKNQIIVEAEIPGVNKEDLKITLQDNILTLEGEKKKEDQEKEKNFYRVERTYGSFKRSFNLPYDVDSEKVEAKFEDGLLMISLQKFEEKKKIEKNIKLK